MFEDEETTTEELKQKISALEKTVAEYKQLEGVLRERDEEYLNLLHSIPDPVVIVQENNNALLNKAFSKLFRYGHPDFYRGSRFFYGIRGNDGPGQLKAGAGETKTFHDFNSGDLKVKEKRIVPCEAKSTMIKYKGEAANFVIFRDIVGHNPPEADEKKDLQRLSLALDIIQDGLWDWDFNQNRFHTSARLRELIGATGDESKINIDHWSLHIHPDHRGRVLEMLQDILERKTPCGVDYLYRPSNDKEFRWHHMCGKAFFDERGKAYRIAGYIRDITAEKQAEELIRGLTHSLTNSQENERQKISHELHNSVVQSLFTLKSACERVLEYKSLTLGVRERISKISESLKAITILVRNISYNLRPPGLEKLGLIRTVDQQCKDFAKGNHIDVEFRSSDIKESKLDYDTKINLYRIFQEILNNIKKHFASKHIYINLTSSFQHIILLIKDDRVGFDMDEDLSHISNEMRIGLQNLQERVFLLKGEMEVAADSKKGTKILIKIPFDGNEEGAFAVYPYDNLDLTVDRDFYMGELNE